MTSSNRRSVYGRSLLIVCWLLMYNPTFLAKNDQFGIWHSDFLEVGTKIDKHNNGLLDEGKIERFCLDIGRIIGNFHLSIVVPMGTLGVNVSS